MDDFGPALDWMAKLAASAVSEEEARAALDRISTLEAKKPTTSQMARYGTIGGVSGVTIGAVGDAIRGRALFGHDPSLKGWRKGVNIARNVAADAAKGVIGAGVMPLVNNNLDQQAEMGKLKDFVRQRAAAPAPAVKVASEDWRALLPAPPSLGVKTAGIATTPAGRLASSQARGMAPGALAKSGPSVAQIAKPKGFGEPLAGAIKT